MLHVSGELHKKLRSVALNFITNSRSRPDFLHFVEDLAKNVMKPWENTTQVAFFKEAKKVRARQGKRALFRNSFFNCKNLIAIYIYIYM